MIVTRGLGRGPNRGSLVASGLTRSRFVGIFVAYAHKVMIGIAVQGVLAPQGDSATVIDGSSVSEIPVVPTVEWLSVHTSVDAHRVHDEI